MIWYDMIWYDMYVHICGGKSPVGKLAASGFSAMSMTAALRLRGAACGVHRNMRQRRIVFRAT